MVALGEVCPIFIVVELSYLAEMTSEFKLSKIGIRSERTVDGLTSSPTRSSAQPCFRWWEFGYACSAMRLSVDDA